MSAGSKFQVGRVIDSEAVLFAEGQDRFRLKRSKSWFRLGGQARKLIPKERGLTWIDAFSADRDQETV